MSDQTPVGRVDDWTEAVLEKLIQVGSIAEEVGADAVLDNGDFFDIKSPRQNSHELVRKVADLHGDYPCPVFGNVGNHDCVYGNLDYLPQQPLGVLFSTGTFQRCYGEHEQVFQDEDVSVRVVGVPYHGTEYDLERLKIEKKDEGYLVVMAHLLASPKGGKMFESEDIVKYEQLVELAPDVTCWIFGHWHKDQGIQELSNGAKVVNLGSLTRGSLALDDIDRKPAVSILRFDEEGFTAERRDLEVKHWSDVFDLEQRVRTEARSMTMGHYVESLTKTLQEAQQGASLKDKVRASQVADKVKERTLLFLEEAEAE